jgi:hypothetical protein
MVKQARLIVLRFRDIGIPDGDTVRHHADLIASRDSCWWGWLSRQHERNPHVELKSLREQFGASFDVALYDTGQGVIYRATCTDIRVSPKERRSPDPTLTPAYYNDRKSVAWFRLSQIERVEDTFVLGRTCVAMPSAAPDAFTDLLAQHVDALRDLRRQEVTLWVLD